VPGAPHPAAVVVLLGLVLAPSGCLGLFAPDGTSVSVGTHARGALVRAVELPEEGAGYAVPPAWRRRDRRYATQEVVHWLTTAFAMVARQDPEAIAALGDLSGRVGGRSIEHRSHESGRDVDIFFFAMDADGRPYHPQQAMLRFGPDGRAVAWSPPVRGMRVREPVPPARFDAHRTWALVRALVAAPGAQVQWIFIHRALGELLLAQASSEQDDAALIARAAALFHQPSDAQAHDDHMHVRVFCPPGDRLFGCVDRGPQRWWKKRWKEMGEPYAEIGFAAPADQGSPDVVSVEQR
jgi:penicillin-insensitive murein endopeptidase